MIRRAAAFALLAGLAASASAAEMQRADVEAIVRDYLAAHPEVVESIVKGYIARNPEVVGDAFTDIVRRRLAASPAAAAARPAETAAAARAAIATHARLLFDSPRQAVLGNAQGDVTLVEFFDYNCGYCKHAIADTLALLRDDPKLRIVLKEYPILGPPSLEAARVSIAARMQDAGGGRFLAFHTRLLGTTGPIGAAAALAAAREAGFDIARLERDLAGDEVAATLAENAGIARDLGIRGTPGYVVGTAIIPGAIGAAGLKERIAAARAVPHP